MIFVGIGLSRIALELMDTPADVIDLSVTYMRIYFGGMPFFMLYNYGAAILSAVGDTKRPLMFLAAAGMANAVLDLRLTYPDTELIAALPFEGQAAGFPVGVRREYDAILASADRIEVVGSGYSPDVFLRRDDYMVERAGLFVAWYDGRRGGTSYTVSRARARGLRVINLYRDGLPELFADR